MNDYNLPTCSWRFYRNIFRWHWYIKIGQLYPSSEFYYTIQREDLVQTIINGIFNINFPIFIIRIYFKCTVRTETWTGSGLILSRSGSTLFSLKELWCVCHSQLEIVVLYLVNFHVRMIFFYKNLKMLSSISWWLAQSSQRPIAQERWFLHCFSSVLFYF